MWGKGQFPHEKREYTANLRYNSVSNLSENNLNKEQAVVFPGFTDGGARKRVV